MPRIFKPYDVFISYVVEDREVVEDLYKKLNALGLRVWYAKKELYPGADIRQVINTGLRSCRFGIAVISPSYKSHWALGELFYFMTREKALIPLLHELKLEEIVIEHPEVITRFCLLTSDGIDQIARHIVKRVEVRYPFVYRLIDLGSFLRKDINRLNRVLVLILLFSLPFLFFWQYQLQYPRESLVKFEVEKVVGQIDRMVQQEFAQDIVQNDEATLSSLNEVQLAEESFQRLSQVSGQRNMFDFFNGVEHIKSLTGIKNAGILPPSQSPAIPFGLTQYKAYLLKPDKTNTKSIKYAFINLLDLEYKIKDYRLNESFCEVDILYTNFLQYAVVDIVCDSIRGQKRHYVHLYGVKPQETFVFEKEADNWVLMTVR